MEDLELRIMDLEQRLAPIANRPVDITRPGWTEELQQSRHPFDRAGIRAEAESLLEELIRRYRNGTDADRQAIRKLFVEYKALAWAASLPFAPTNEVHARQHLLLFSMKDQGQDSRDALLSLQDLCRTAQQAGVDLAPLLVEVAQLSSDENRFGMGSTRQMLWRACPPVK